MSGVQSAGVQRLVEAEKTAATRIKQARNGVCVCQVTGGGGGATRAELGEDAGRK